MFVAIIAKSLYKFMTARCAGGCAAPSPIFVSRSSAVRFNYVFTQTLLATHPEIVTIK